MNLFSLLDQAATRFPNNGAVFRGTEQVHSFAELRSRALRLAAALRERGRPGDRIAIVSENAPEYVELFFAVWAAGMAATPINAKLHAKEVVQILEDAGASVVFVSGKLAPGLEHELKGSPAAECLRVVIGSERYTALLKDEMTGPVDPTPEALAWLFFTSGTTGRSKGAMLSHRNLMALTIAHLADVEAVDEASSLLHGAPMSHGSGLYMPAYIARGARQVVPASSAFDPAEFLDLCDHHPGCGAFLAPTMVQRLRLEAERSGRRPANLRSIVYGGGPMYVEELKKSLATFGPVFAQIYGQGESPMTITGLRRADHATDDDGILGSVGYARSGVEVAVVDDQGRPLPAGEIGEIVCRGDVVMSGYWNNPKATADALRDGWLYTGDMGAFDERGYLTLRDRSKDVIISGGTNIYPREVEEALLRHPGVAEVCVTGQPHEEWGEIVVAFIVPTPGVDLASAALDEHCAANIARFKKPKRYVFVEALPKNNYGKVLKRELRQQLADGL
ncbi:AMP-binding protein [Azospirillum rugosum]|uniref:Acyl-CoA synthetase (AMP-forming)/AMP-acid ligase II n=1 Tax=Azospirillum rugosum TaxID=416170 RepID=A0ABS4SQL0_9PROT|nr:AMP-binding protein [Azospirillum rugosum]MBP2293680.1 acyl-CoA synthetase (AMP-forming)/AMP-acid ligase II [Azospirillum rugosum]MDQ0527225.1 acyl-CoA synthetase (AMP-forming)/AMP-acid ligase II [Azospirillum rugosum]